MKLEGLITQLQQRLFNCRFTMGLFSLELNEEVLQEMQQVNEGDNKEKLDKIIYTPPLSPVNQCNSSSTYSVGITRINSIVPSSDPKKRPLRISNFCRLIRSKSKSPLQKKLDKLLK